MYVACKQLFVTLLLATVFHATYAAYNVTLHCTLIKSGTKLPSSDSCSQYYVCSANGKYETKDCGSGFSFEKNKQTCLASGSVECYYGLENPCLGKNGTHVPDVSGCGKWFYCADGAVKGSGKCPTGQALSAGKCEYSDCKPTDAPETDETAIPICDIMPTDKWFGNTDDCATYAICRAGAPVAIDKCKNDLVFDVQRELCNYLSQTDCSRTSGSDSGIGDVTESCLDTDEGAIKANPKVCSSYLVCEKLKYVSKSCPAGQFWDAAGAACMSRKAATPDSSCDRCEGTKGSTFANSVDSTCQGYLVCKDGKKTGSGDCPGGYFDEESIACIINAKPEQSDVYKNNHGACSAATVCTCGALVNDKCATSASCQCGFEDVVGGTCIQCTPDTDGVCTQTAACACTGDVSTGCADAANASCECGFDANLLCTDCDAKACDFYCEGTSSTCTNGGTGGSCGNSASGADDCVPCKNGLEPAESFCAADV